MYFSIEVTLLSSLFAKFFCSALPASGFSIGVLLLGFYYAEYHYAECHYAECRSTDQTWVAIAVVTDATSGFCLARGGSTVVEYQPGYPKAKGSRPASTAEIGLEKMGEGGVR